MKIMDRFVRDYAPGHEVFREGDPGSSMYVVLTGDVTVHKGEEAHVLARLGRGEMFGEMALVSSGRRTASVRAGLQGARLMAVDQARFVYLVSQQPAFALSVMKMMAERLERENLARLDTKSETSGH